MLNYLTEDYYLAYINLLKLPFFNEKNDVIVILSNMTHSGQIAAKYLAETNFVSFLIDYMSKESIEINIAQNALILLGNLVKIKDLLSVKDKNQIFLLSSKLMNYNDIQLKTLAIMILAKLSNDDPPYIYMLSKDGDNLVKAIYSFEKENKNALFQSITFFGNLLTGDSKIIKVNFKKYLLYY